MAGNQARVYVGTVGQSVWRSDDSGETFKRASAGLFSECEVRALAVHPARSEVIYAGTDRGCYRSESGGDSWEHQESPMDRTQIWSLAIDRSNPQILLAGVCPAAIYRSLDGGDTWQRLQVDMPDRCEGTLIVPRVTCLTIDLDDSRRIYAGVEIGGARRSRDGGETWETLTRGLSSQDIHGLAVVPGRRPGSRRILLASTNNDVNRSLDDGDTWEPLNVGTVFPWPYCRAAASAPEDPDLVYLGCGNGPPGNQGALFRTRDGGSSWERMALPIAPNSTVWNLGFNAADPQRLYASSISGQLYRSLNGGASWQKMPHEFGEIRALAWVPA
jgi:photosystem II stability/assembly factor-like uncharacterized protein